MKRTAVCLMSVFLLAFAAGFVAAEKTYDISEVNVIRTDSGFMYTYRDESGQLIVRDVPPPGYLESLTAARAQQEMVPDEPDELPPPTPVPDDGPAAWTRPALWLLSLSLVMVSAYIFFSPLIRCRLGESKIERILRRACFPVFTDVELAGSGHPPARIDYLACTPSGVLVIGNAHFAGKVKGNPDDDFWMQAVHHDRMQIDNPLRKNARDTRIVKSLLGDVPVHGRVVYTGRAELAADTQAKMHKLLEFKQTLNFFEAEAPDQRRLAGGWRTLMRYPRANRVAVRPLGAGWKRWLHFHWRAVASSSLLLMSVTVMSVLLWLQWF